MSPIEQLANLEHQLRDVDHITITHTDCSVYIVTSDDLAHLQRAVADLLTAHIWGVYNNE